MLNYRPLVAGALALALAACQEEPTGPLLSADATAPLANTNRAYVEVTGHVLADGTFMSPSWPIELQINAITQRDELRGQIHYENTNPERALRFFWGEPTCFLQDGNRAIVGAASTSPDSDWPYMIFYLEDNGPGGSVEPRDRYRPLGRSAPPDCQGEDAPAENDTWYEVFEGTLSLHQEG